MGGWNSNYNLTSYPTLVITEACHLHSRREYLGQAEATVCMQGLRYPVRGKKKFEIPKSTVQAVQALCVTHFIHVYKLTLHY